MLPETRTCPAVPHAACTVPQKALLLSTPQARAIQPLSQQSSTRKGLTCCAWRPAGATAGAAPPTT